MNPIDNRANCAIIERERKETMNEMLDELRTQWEAQQNELIALTKENGELKVALEWIRARMLLGKWEFSGDGEHLKFSLLRDDVIAWNDRIEKLLGYTKGGK
jgi:hypothetical protein